MLGHLSDEAVEAVALGAERPEHLRHCQQCRFRVAAAIARRVLLSGMKPPELDEAAFARVEARLFSVPIRARSTWWRIPVFALAAAAAAVLAFVFWPRTEPRAPTLEAPPVLAHLTATFVQGPVEWRPRADAPFAALELGEGLAEPAEVRTGGGKVALAREGLGLSVPEKAHLSLEAVRPDRTAARIHLGAAAASGGPVELLAGPLTASAVDASFALTRFASETLVEVERGTVRIFGGGASVEVRAPGRLRVKDGGQMGPAEPVSKEALSQRTALALSAPSQKPWVRLEVGELPDGAQVQLDELGWGPPPLRALLSPGRRLIRASVAGEPVRERWVDLSGERVKVDLPPPKVEREPSPSAIAALQDQLKRHLPQLRHCYEKWLKRDRSAQGRVVLTLELSEQGQVTRSRVNGAEVDPAAARCFSDTAKRWRLPSLGSPQTIEVPLVLTTGE